jgi:mevalonate kinase
MIHSSAPATLMLMGEHAVLHGKHALVAAASPRLHVYFRPRLDRNITIHSALGQFEGNLDQLEVTAPFQFILSLIRQAQCPQGFDLEIKSEFSATVGLGSSAAVLVATAAALLEWHPQPQSLFELCYTSLLEVQGQGSGADLMAAILGGIVLYRREPFLATKIWPNALSQYLPICLIYSGYKKPTAEVIQIVECLRQADPAHYAMLFSAIDICVEYAANALLSGNIVGFTTTLKMNQKVMQMMGVSDPNLEQIVQNLEARPDILAAKISGSGLGDCVLAVGSAQFEADFPWTPLELSLSAQGVHIHA